jgi:hypothetical protein
MSTENLSSVVGIQKLNNSRPKPDLKLDFTPHGFNVQVTHSEAFHQRNAEIDKEVSRQERVLRRQKNRARDDFNMAHDRDMDR